MMKNNSNSRPGCVGKGRQAYPSPEIDVLWWCLEVSSSQANLAILPSTYPAVWSALVPQDSCGKEGTSKAEDLVSTKFLSTLDF